MIEAPRYSLCNEVLRGLRFDQQCGFIAEAGLGGIEISPSHTWADPGNPGAAEIGRARESIKRHGLAFAGMHWLLAGNGELSLFHPEKEGRHKSWGHLARLIEASGDLGGGALVLGSPRQRLLMGIEPERGREIFLEGVSGLLPLLNEADSVLLLEALPHEETDFVNTLEEAAALCRAVDSSRFKSMLDFHNMGDESDTAAMLFKKHRMWIDHIHLNGPGGGFPDPKSAAADTALFFNENRELWFSFELFEEYRDLSVLKGQIEHFRGEVNQFLEPSP